MSFKDMREQVAERVAAQARYDELSQRIMIYYLGHGASLSAGVHTLSEAEVYEHLDATIEADVREFGELRKVLFTQEDFVLHGEG